MRALQRWFLWLTYRHKRAPGLNEGFVIED